MKKITLIAGTVIFALTGLIPIGATAQYEALPPELDGSMMPYDFAAYDPIPSLPDSLTPVYAGYVARHGARYLSGPKKIKSVMDALKSAESDGTLSATGREFLQFMKQIERANEGHWGELSPVGVAEQQKLGESMFAMLPALNDSNARVNTIASFVPRAVMTMYQFTHRLILLNDSVSVATCEGSQFSPLLYMFAENPAYAGYRKDGAWKHFYKEYAKQTLPTEPARRLFTTTTLSDKHLRDLTLDIYEVLKGNRAASLPAPTTQWMSEAEYRACWQVSNLQHFLRNSVSTFSDIPAVATIPLLQRIIADADKALADTTESVVLNGYFGHAETLLPLLSLIGIPDCQNLHGNYAEIGSCWKIEELTPLGANIVFLFAEAPTGRYYVTARLNGRNVALIPGQNGPVEWTKLKGYWLDIIKSLEQ